MLSINLGIKWKLMIPTVILMLTMVGLLTYIQIFSQENFLKDELNKRTILMKENLKERAKVFIKNIKPQIENDIASFNFSNLINLINESVNTNSDIEYALLIDKNNQVYVHTLKPELVQTTMDNFLHRNELSIIESENSIKVSTPIEISVEPWGSLSVVYNLNSLRVEIENSSAEFNKKINGIIKNSILTSLIFIFFASIIIFILSTKISNPIIKLTNSAKRMSKGDFSISEIQKSRYVNSVDEVGVLSKAFIEMSVNIQNLLKKLKKLNSTLEEKVKNRTAELHSKNEKLVKTQKELTDNINFASMIQNSILPYEESMSNYFDDYFIIWEPKDIVGGDIYLFEEFEDGCLIFAIDCMGHGVTGAFTTMITKTALSSIINEQNYKNPALILEKLNRKIKTVLKQDRDNSKPDTGLDGGVIFYNKVQKKITFAGAKTDIFYIQNGELNIIKGDKKSIGYKRSKIDFKFTNYEIDINEESYFYLTTDGIIDQAGGIKRLPYGKKRLSKLLLKNYKDKFDIQKKSILYEFKNYQAKEVRRDDITMVAFKICNYSPFI